MIFSLVIITNNTLPSRSSTRIPAPGLWNLQLWYKLTTCINSVVFTYAQEYRRFLKRTSILHYWTLTYHYVNQYARDILSFGAQYQRTVVNKNSGGCWKVVVNHDSKTSMDLTNSLNFIKSTLIFLVFPQNCLV